MELSSLLPSWQRPEHTEGYEGFFHLIGMKGSVEEAEMTWIIRDHDRARFEEKKETILRCCEFINGKYGEGTASPTVRDQYYNMREMVEPHYHIIDKAVKAMEMAGIKIFAGGLNFHGKMEFLPVPSMEKASQVILNIISEYAR